MENQEVNTEVKAVETLLDEGVEFSISAPSLLRVFGKKDFKVSVRKPLAGTALKILKLRLQLNVSDEEFENITVDKVFELQLKHGKKVAEMVALGILREKTLLRPIYVKLLANYLLRVKDFDFLFDIMQSLTLGCGILSFTNTIRLTRYLRLTMPNLSQTTT